MASSKETATKTMEAVQSLAQTEDLKNVMARAITNITDGIEPVTANETIRNDFINTINKIAYAAVNRRSFQNPLAFLIGERIEYGDAIEEFSIEPMEAENFEVSSAAMASLLKYEPPNTMSAVHRINRDVIYSVDISNALLRRAFTNYSNFNSMLEQIIQELYNGMYINQYKWTTGILGAAVINKGITMIEGMTLPTDKDSGQAFLKKATGFKKSFPFPSKKYNAAERTAFTNPNDIYLFITAEAATSVDIDVLLYAFNPNKADIVGQYVVLDEIPDPTYGTFAVLCSKNFIRINPQIVESGNFFNTKTFTTKHSIHSSELYSYSPFENAVGFCTGTGYTKTKFDGSIT